MLIGITISQILSALFWSFLIGFLSALVVLAVVERKIKKMRNTKAKLLRKGCNNKGQSRQEYQVLKNQYKSLNKPLKRDLALKVKEASKVKAVA